MNLAVDYLGTSMLGCDEPISVGLVDSHWGCLAECLLSSVKYSRKGKKLDDIEEYYLKGLNKSLKFFEEELLKKKPNLFIKLLVNDCEDSFPRSLSIYEKFEDFYQGKSEKEKLDMLKSHKEVIHKTLSKNRLSLRSNKVKDFISFAEQLHTPTEESYSRDDLNLEWS